ncbi:hypothetical protein Q428_07435 [Fervidicella metallireducens AeB]|uniref:Transporter n=1 Tax=Fervidicella metallireducens AeB TaxID=1403537 RepID=A0A017RV75_9CLOT|nr:hypothetical protein [Fervidicella metallireducens]EYE88501.1 hypothetical protein Q428_07435 [Fervidicella metallireducens AeB]
MKNDLKIAFVFIGTIVGAGLASGQEVLQFFSRYGIKGFYGIILCCIIYFLISVIIVNLCFKNNYGNYNAIIRSVFGERLGWIVDLILTLFIFGSNTIMISGGGAMLNEYAGINKTAGIFIMASLVFLVAIFSTEGLILVNSIIVPFSTSIIVILGIAVFFVNPDYKELISNIHISVPPRSNWVLSSILYASFNLTVATGVICPMISEGIKKKHFINGCILGSAILTALAAVINFSILIYAPKSFYTEIPNLYIAKEISSVLPFIVTCIIWLEMFSTEIGNLYSLSKRLQGSLKVSYTFSLIIIILFSIPFSFLGFSNLIKMLYPPFGVISFVFLIGCTLKYFKTR